MNKIGWMQRALRHRCCMEQNWPMTTPRCWWYALKACICLAIGRQPPPDDYGAARFWETEAVSVAIANSHATYSVEWGAGQDWDVLYVGEGVWRNWWYKIGSNGYP